MSEFKTFVVPYDFSDHAKVALQTAVDLAGRLDATLHLVNVVQKPIYSGAYGASAPPYIDTNEIREATLRSLTELAAELEPKVGKVIPHVVEEAHIAVALTELARSLEADLIVMGTHGRTGLAHAFLGSVAERTMRQAPCPVLTVQDPHAE